MVMASLSLVCGLILDTVTAGRRELKRLSYLAAGQLHATQIDRKGASVTAS
jgi:hypothetical protein